MFVCVCIQPSSSLKVATVSLNAAGKTPLAQTGSLSVPNLSQITKRLNTITPSVLAASQVHPTTNVTIFNTDCTCA